MDDSDSSTVAKERSATTANTTPKSRCGINSQADNHLLRKIIKAATEVKAKDIVALDVQEAFGLADNFLILSGRSDRHVQGIANKMIEDLSAAGIKPLAMEGYEKGHWILIDFDDVIVHLFYEPVREYYDLESLWVNAKKVDIGGYLKGEESKEAA